MATDLEDYVIKKNKIKKSKTNNKDLNYYNKHFKEKFTLKKNTNNDWQQFYLIIQPKKRNQKNNFIFKV